MKLSQLLSVSRKKGRRCFLACESMLDKIPQSLRMAGEVFHHSVQATKRRTVAISAHTTIVESDKLDWNSYSPLPTSRIKARRFSRMSRLSNIYPVIVITCVHYLGPPGPFSSPDSRDLLEVLGDFLGRERGGVPRGSSRTLGDPPWGSLSAKTVLREPRGGPENLGRRRVPEVRDTEPS